MRDPEEAKKYKKQTKEAEPEENEDEESDEINLDDFLKEGGIDVEVLEDQVELTEAEKSKNSKKKDAKDVAPVVKIVGREDMCGWLFKSNDDMKKDKAIFDFVLNTVTDTFHSVGTT